MYQDKELKLTDLTDKDYRRSTIILAALVITALVFKALILSRFPIFEDEFHYLSQVYEYERGELTTAFQTFHVHFFGWLSAVGNNEVSQVMAARIVMYILLLGTCFYLFRLTCYFLGVRAALFCVLCYLCAFFTIANGASFRPDTPATFFFMLAFYYFVVHEESIFSNILAGLAMAVALLFTIKSSVYLPVFAIWFFSRHFLRGRWSKPLIRTGCFIGSLIIGFIILYKLHVATLPQPVGKKSVSFLSRAFSTFIAFEKPFSTHTWIIRMLTVDSMIFFLLLFGLILHVTDLFKHRYTRNNPKAFLLVLLIPLSSIMFFKYSRPYLFVFLIPSAIVFCGYTFEFLTTKCAKRVTVPALSLVLGFMIFSNFIIKLPRFITEDLPLARTQRTILNAIHTMFPEPVPYVDRFSMVSSYPKVGFFMSEAGWHNYHRRAESIMGPLLNEKKPLFMLENSVLMDLNSSKPIRGSGGEGFLEADWTALRLYFIHHVGPIWVVGKQFNFSPLTELQHFDIEAPGLYTVESQADILIDGTSYHNSEIVRLEEGKHNVEANGLNEAVKLRWGDHLHRPDIELKWDHLDAPFY